jgi:hypothetical protein
MPASNPSMDLESDRARFGNLEGSVRSRGADAEIGRDRDLIEAGLSEPADGMRDYGDFACAVRPESSYRVKRARVSAA